MTNGIKTNYLLSLSILLLFLHHSELVFAGVAGQADGEPDESPTYSNPAGCSSDSHCRVGQVCRPPADGTDPSQVRRCVCASAGHCRRGRRPVCASNGQVYPSRCHLHRDACLTRRRIRIVRLGCPTLAGKARVNNNNYRTQRGDKTGHRGRKVFTKFLSVKSGASRADLLCDVEPAGKSDRMEWLKNGIPFTVEEHLGKANNETRLLILRDVTTEDAGQYQCRSFIYNDLLAQNISLAVIAEPIVRVYPSMLVRRSGESADFFCDIQATLSVARMRWHFDAEPLQPGEKNIRISESGHWLHISRLDRNHTGIYSCRVENMAGAAEVGGSLYVRTPEETALTSYALSDSTFDTSVLILHSCGATAWNGASCDKDLTEGGAGIWELSTDWDVTLCENLIACDWGPTIMAGRSLVYAAQPSLGRILRFKPGEQRPGQGSRQAYNAVQLNCAVKSLSYDQQADRVWAACADGRVFTVDEATHHKPPVGRLWRHQPGETVLATPDRVNQYVIVRISGEPATISVLYRSGQRRLAVQLSPSEDAEQRSQGWRQTATVLPQGGILLIYSVSTNETDSGSPSSDHGGEAKRVHKLGPPIVAVDLRTGRRLYNYLSNGGRGNDESRRPVRGSLYVSPYGDYLVRVSGMSIAAYKIRPNGEPAAILADPTGGLALRSLAFQRGTDGRQRVLSVTDRPSCLLTVWLERRQFQLTIDENFSDKSDISAPAFGDRALLYSGDSATFLRTDQPGGVQPAGGLCGRRLFLQLQRVLWLID